MGEISEKIDIAGVLAALGVKSIQTVNPFDLDAAKQAVQQAAQQNGVSAVIFKAPCIAVAKPETGYQVEQAKCIRCQKCIRELGCPAIVISDGQVSIESSLCYGCSICAQVCPTGAIQQRKGEKA